MPETTALCARKAEGRQRSIAPIADGRRGASSIPCSPPDVLCSDFAGRSWGRWLHRTFPRRRPQRM